MLSQSIGPYVKAIFKRNLTDKTRFSEEKVSCDCLISPVQIRFQQANTSRETAHELSIFLMLCFFGLRHFIELVCFNWHLTWKLLKYLRMTKSSHLFGGCMYVTWCRPRHSFTRMNPRYKIILIRSKPMLTTLVFQLYVKN